MPMNTNIANMNAREVAQITLDVLLDNGATFPFRGVRSQKNGALYFAILKRRNDGSFYDPRQYGTRVDAAVVGGKLPKTMTLAGQQFKAESGLTVSGNKKVTFKGIVELDGVRRGFWLSISELPNGDFNVSGTVSQPYRDKKKTGPKARVVATNL